MSRSAAPDDDETGAQTLLWPHFPEDLPDIAFPECEANHGRVPGLVGDREDPGVVDDRVGPARQVDPDLVPGCEVAGRGRQGKGERRAVVGWRRRLLRRVGAGHPEGEVQGEQEGARGEPATDEGQAPGRAPGGPEERREVLGETRGGHAPRLGAPRPPPVSAQPEVEEEPLEVELVDELLDSGEDDEPSESEEPDEPFDPSDGLLARESVR